MGKKKGKGRKKKGEQRRVKGGRDEGKKRDKCIYSIITNRILWNFLNTYQISTPAYYMFFFKNTFNHKRD